VAEPDDVGAVLSKATGKRQPLGVKGEGDKAILAVAIVAHEDGELAVWLQGLGTVAKELAITA
jgi:hypothetical protein